MAIEATYKTTCDGCGKTVVVQSRCGSWQLPEGWDYGPLVYQREEEICYPRWWTKWWTDEFFDKRYGIKTGVRFMHLCPECLVKKKRGGSDS